MNKGLGLVVGAAVLAASLIGTSPTADAAEKNWVWRAGGDRVGVASYTDSGDVVRVNDMEKDGRSVLLDVWKSGRRGGTHVYCWDSTGSKTGGVHCNNAFKGAGWGKNAKLVGRLCKGESGPGPKGGKVLKCQAKRGWKTFYR